MKELGSDFHRLDNFVGTPSEIERLNPMEFANGRMALLWLIGHKQWKRLWMPEYFCYEVIDTISKTGIDVAFYPDYPEGDDNALIKDLSFKEGDALLRMNYFGLRAVRDESEILVDVIEDHSHGLLTDWAQHSNADYCIASLRKTFSIPEGGILWSPKGHILPQPAASSDENDHLVYKRFAAMSLKTIYMNGGGSNKELFRRLYIETENGFGDLPLTAMSVFNKQLYFSFDYKSFDEAKRENWYCLTSLLSEQIDYLVPENNADTPFSLILRFASESRRNILKKKLIENNVYPAELWPVPEKHKRNEKVYLSIHCDGRYTSDDMEKLATMINDAYKVNNIRIIDIEDGEWDNIVESFANYDIYYLRGYVKAFQLHGDGMPELMYYDTPTLRAIYVYMKRELDDGWFDITTPYGYGGVLFEGETDEECLQAFNAEFVEQMRTNRIVDNFVRFHPVLGNADVNRCICDVVDLGETVVIDLDSEETIWNNFTSKNRNKIRKAEKNGVKIKHGKGMELLDEFAGVYNQTMEHDDATDYYYFERDFYESIDRDLKENYEMFYALYNGKIVAMSIMLFVNGKMHYHLSGSLYEFRALAPTNLLLYQAALWGMSQGFKSLHLGGGVGSGRDNLYKFKEGFNRNHSLQFSIGKQIFCEKKYNELVKNRKEDVDGFDFDSSFFPLYRSK